jgi:nucleotide-binding universal stress UspA family protein
MEGDRAKVIVGISPSLSGLEALRFAIAEARRSRVPLVAVRAWFFPTGVRARPTWEWERELAAEARRCITAAFQTAVGDVPDDIDVVARTPSGRVDTVLKDGVTSPQDLIVIGAAARWWASSGVVRGCVRAAGCPVVVVPPPELARAVGGGRLSARRMAREAAALAKDRSADGR